MRLAKLPPALVAETQFLIIGNQRIILRELILLKLEMFVEEIDQKCM
jgi:hypothetical protein